MLFGRIKKDWKLLFSVLTGMGITWLFFFFHFGNDNLPMSVLKCLIGIPPSTCQIPLSTFLTFLPLQSLPATVMVSEQNLDMLLSYQYMQWKCYGKKILWKGLYSTAHLAFWTFLNSWFCSIISVAIEVPLKKPRLHPASIIKALSIFLFFLYLFSK